MNPKNIFLIDGASGCGKSDFVEYVNSMKEKVGFLIKFTTREIRDYEKDNLCNLDLFFCNKQEFEKYNFEYQYEYEKQFYGFSKHELDLLIEKCDNIFIIIRNIPLMRRIKREYNNQNVISVYIHSDLLKIEERLKMQQFNDKQIAFRLSRIETTYKDYVLNSAFFDEVIVNNSNIDYYHLLIDNLIKKYAKNENGIV